MKRNLKIFGVIGGVIVILLIACLGKLVEDVPANKIIVNQVPVTGTMEYWTTPGFRWQKFGNTTEYDKTRQLWFSDVEGEGGEGVNDLSINIRFNDAGTGKVSGSLRIKLPVSETHLSRIQVDYTGMDKLMNDLVRTTTVKVIQATGPLMSSFESYAEKKNDLIFYITDQLVNGVYKTITRDEKIIDPITDEEKVVKIASLVPDSLAPGGYARQEASPFAFYGLEIGQLSISNIEYEDKILDQISTQQAANMAVQTSKAQALEARQQAIRAEEEGKARATTAKWKQEEVKAVEVTKAEQAYEVARFRALEAEEEAKKIIQEGKAQAEANRLKVQAGLTPQEKAEWDYKTKVGVAEAFSKYDGAWVPTVVSGSSTSGGGQAMDALGIKMVMDIVDKISK